MSEAEIWSGAAPVEEQIERMGVRAELRRDAVFRPADFSMVEFAALM